MAFNLRGKWRQKARESFWLIGEIIINNRIPTLQMHSNHFSENGTSANIVTNTDTNTNTTTHINTDTNTDTITDTNTD